MQGNSPPPANHVGKPPSKRTANAPARCSHDVDVGSPLGHFPERKEVCES